RPWGHDAPRRAEARDLDARPLWLRPRALLCTLRLGASRAGPAGRRLRVLARISAARTGPILRPARAGHRVGSVGPVGRLLGSGFTVLAARGRERRTANLEPNPEPSTQNPERRHTKRKTH